MLFLHPLETNTSLKKDFVTALQKCEMTPDSTLFTLVLLFLLFQWHYPYQALFSHKWSPIPLRTRKTKLRQSRTKEHISWWDNNECICNMCQYQILVDYVVEWALEDFVIVSNTMKIQNRIKRYIWIKILIYYLCICEDCIAKI